MTEHIPDPAYDEPAGDVGVQESDAVEDPGADREPLEGTDPLDQDSDDASDDPVHGGQQSSASRR